MSDKVSYTLCMGKTDFKLNEIHQNEEISSIPYNAQTVLIDGPFYANGSLHLGHFANKIFKDAFVRTNNLFGISTCLQVTSDQHGLPIEIEVEKKYGKTDNFITQCRQYAKEQFANQLEQVKKFGILVDNKTIETASFDYEAYEMERLHQLYKEGKLVRLLRPVNFCSDCNSSLAEAEVEYKDKESHSLVVKFELTEDTYLLVWTTTPYTLFFNKAVAFNPNLSYVKWEDNGINYITVKEKAIELDKEYTVFDLNNVFVTSPLTKSSVPVLAADYVESSGTGLVHIAPNFGVDDYRVGVKYDLEIVDCINNFGKFNNLCPTIEGKNIKDASITALDLLTNEGLIYSLDKIKHSVGHCWRHKTPLFFKASKEWFLNLSDISSQYENEKYTFYPKNSENRLQSMIDSRKLWCVSRNRKWGVPLPFLYDENDNVVNDDALIKSAIERVRQEGIESWYKLDTTYKISNQVADVWLDSGILYDYYKHKTNTEVTNNVVLAEGSDQHRGWFNSTVCTNLLLGNINTNLRIFTHGFVVDEKGLKLSKSNKNYVELDELFKKYSPDLLRYLILSQNIHQDIVFSKDLLTQSNEKYKKIRNTFRFVIQNCSIYNDINLEDKYDFDYEYEANKLNSDLFDIIIYKLNNLKKIIKSDGLENLNYHDVCRAIYDFANEVSVYFDSFKDILYCDDKYSLSRYAICKFLTKIAFDYASIVSIIMPFTAQEYVNFNPLEKNKDINLYVTRIALDPLAHNITEMYNKYTELKQDINKVFLLSKTDEYKQLNQFKLDISQYCLGDIDSNPDIVQLSSLFGVAKVNVLKEGNGVYLSPYIGIKCPRCWNIHNDSDILCNRCVTVENNLKGK